MVLNSVQLFVILAISIPVVSAHSATLYVSSAGGNDGNPGTQAQPFLTIQAAINGATSGDTIKLAPGTYSSKGDYDLTMDGKSLSFGDNTISAEGQIIDCTGASDDKKHTHTGFIINKGESASIKNITIENGHGKDYGGAIYSEGYLDLEGCRIVNNSSRFGGGVYFAGNGEFNNNYIRNNRATYGGGVYASTYLDVYEGDTSFNKAYDGGAFYLFSGGSITQGMMDSNQASHDGGAVYIASDTSATLSQLTIVRNSSGPQYSHPVLLEDDIEKLNNSGGGIYADGDLQIDHSMISENHSANSGAGICSRATTSMANCIVTLNDAYAGYGGGIFNDHTRRLRNASTISISYSTIAGNKALDQHSRGGGIEIEGNGTINDSIVWGNSAITQPEISKIPTLGSFADVTYCDVEGGWPGRDNIIADPLFTDLTKSDVRISNSSPCLKDGNSISTSDTDFREDIRPSTPTIGAFEPGMTGVTWDAWYPLSAL